MDINKISSLIDNLPGVCAEGRKAVRAIVEEITGKKLFPEITLRAGDVYRDKRNGNKIALFTASLESFNGPGASKDRWRAACYEQSGWHHMYTHSRTAEEMIDYIQQHCDPEPIGKLETTFLPD